METTYWNGNGNHQTLVEQLQKLVPTMGEIKGSKNKNLERFRKASNAYYDIFNNGGMNRMRSISKFFSSWVSFWLKRKRDNPSYFNDVGGWEQIHFYTEPKMDEVILAAAREQGLI